MSFRFDPEPDQTHYIPAFTVFRGHTQRRQQAACGSFVSKDDFSSEPTCPECLAYVNADPYKDKTGAEVF